MRDIYINVPGVKCFEYFLMTCCQIESSISDHAGYDVPMLMDLILSFKNADNILWK